eukprot:RCo018901
MGSGSSAHRGARSRSGAQSVPSTSVTESELPPPLPHSMGGSRAGAPNYPGAYFGPESTSDEALLYAAEMGAYAQHPFLLAPGGIPTVQMVSVAVNGAFDDPNAVQGVALELEYPPPLPPPAMSGSMSGIAPQTTQPNLSSASSATSEPRSTAELSETYHSFPSTAAATANPLRSPSAGEAGIIGSSGSGAGSSSSSLPPDAPGSHLPTPPVAPFSPHPPPPPVAPFAPPLPRPEHLSPIAAPESSLPSLSSPQTGPLPPPQTQLPLQLPAWVLRGIIRFQACIRGVQLRRRLMEQLRHGTGVFARALEREECKAGSTLRYIDGTVAVVPTNPSPAPAASPAAPSSSASP